MLGTQFTLLREEFSKPLRDTTPERKTITVFTGGSDPLNIAPALVQQLVQDEHLFKYRVFVVSGELNPNIQDLITMASRFNRVTIAINPSSISDIMDNTSIAVSSGGSILYELCSRGIPYKAQEGTPSALRKTPSPTPPGLTAKFVILMPDDAGQRKGGTYYIKLFFCILSPWRDKGSLHQAPVKNL